MRATYLCAACGTNLVEHHSMCCEPCMDAYSARAHIHKCPECDANELCHDAECTFVSVNPGWHPRGEPRLCDEHQAAVRQARTIRRLRALADGYRARAKEQRQLDYFCEGCGHYIAKMDLLPSGVCAVHRTVPAESWRAVSVATGVAARERARIVARLRELASELRAEAETHGDTVFGTVAAVQEKTIEGLVSIIEKSEEP